MAKDPSASRRERGVLFYTCTAHALTHIYMLLFTAIIYPMSLSFGLGADERRFLAIVTVSTVLFGVGAVPAGWLADRIGEKRLLVAFFIISAMGSATIGFAHSIPVLIVGMAVLGLGASIYHPAGMSLISKEFSRAGHAMGVNGLWGSFGTAAGPFLAVWATDFYKVTDLIAPEESWRWSYLLLAPVSLLLGWGLYRMPLPRIEVESGAESQSGPPRIPDIPFRVWRIAPLLFAMACGGLYFSLVTTMLPTHLEESAGFAAESKRKFAGSFTAMIYILGGLGQYISGRFVQRREGRGMYCVVLLIAAPLVFSLSRLEGGPLVAISALMAIAIFTVQPIENVLLSRYSPRHLRGIVFGTKFILVFGIGGSGPWLSGVVSHRYDVGQVFALAAVFTALAFVAAIVAWRAK